MWQLKSERKVSLLQHLTNKPKIPNELKFKWSEILFSTQVQIWNSEIKLFASVSV